MSQKTDNFINVIAPIAVELYNNNEDWVLPSVMIAQGALESGWDASGAHSLFGIKGAGVSSKTMEYINGNYVEVVDSFRTYPDVTSACVDYWDLITKNPRYSKVKNNPDYKSAVDGLIHTTDGLAYATSPTYIEKVISIIEDFNLTRFDVRGEYSVPTATRKSNEDIAVEVFHGKWGNGDERYNRLTSAGYDYNAIQSIVNDMVANRDNNIQPEPQKTLQVGTPIQIRQGAVDLDHGCTYADFVYNRIHTVTEVIGNRVVFDYDGVVVGAVDSSNVILV